MIDNNELKVCPFCGSNGAYVDTSDEGWYNVFVPAVKFGLIHSGWKKKQ